VPVAQWETKLEGCSGFVIHSQGADVQEEGGNQYDGNQGRGVAGLSRLNRAEREPNSGKVRGLDEAGNYLY